MVPETARQHGIELFNAREFYECHEVLEDLWRPTQGVERFFLQAVIHFAVGFYHHQRGNHLGSRLVVPRLIGATQGPKRFAEALAIGAKMKAARLS